MFILRHRLMGIDTAIGVIDAVNANMQKRSLSMREKLKWVEVDIVDGFECHNEVLSADEERDAVELIDKEGRWEQDYQRSAQRYGLRYNYETKTLTRIDPIPSWLEVWAGRFCKCGWMPEPATQITVQEYQPGTGIGEHIDDKLCFGSHIVTISLLSPCTYRLTHRPSLQQKTEILPPRCAVVLSREARSIWKHGILTTQKHQIRSRRLSITFRTVNPERVIAS
jgi:alkylated DNA repair dioxygenase AlkB